MKKRKVKKEHSLKQMYRYSFAFIKESKNFIYFVIGVFVLFALIGFFLPVPEELAQQIFQTIQNLIAQTEGMGQLELTAFIFWNNLKTSLIGMVLGIALGIYPLIVSFTNGYLIGFVSRLSVRAEGISSLWRLVPHGIFELPAVFISLGLGLKIGSFILQKKKSASLKEYFTRSVIAFTLIVVPLLIIAAVIEGALIALLR